MTTSSSINKFRYEGNGSTDTFAFTGRIFSASDLVVEIILRSTDTLVETLELTTDYTVTINSDESSSIVVGGAKIPSALQDIQIRRFLPQTQTLDLPTGTRFPAVSVEDALDKLACITQDLQEQIDRKVGIPVTDSEEAPDVIALLEDATAATAADVVLTNADVVSTNADVVTTGNNVDYAEEWAVKAEDSAVSVAAGGNASTTFSALHWAAKAAASAATATIGNLFGLTTATIATNDFLAFSDTSDSNTGKKATVADVVGAALLDEDDMSSNSATQAPTQQSVKAYVDTEVAGASDLLGSYTASNATSVDIGSGLDLDAAIDGTYDVYVLKSTDILPATSGSRLLTRTSNDGGTTFDAASSDYAWVGLFQDSSATAVNGRVNTAASEIELMLTDGAHDDMGVQLELLLFNPSGTTLETQMKFDVVYGATSTAVAYAQGAAARLAEESVDALRIFFNSGNIASGTFYLYGIKKS